MMKLYGYYRSSTTYRLRIALELKGIDYEYIPVNLLTSEQKGEAFTSRNPFGSVPMLEADGRDRAQSMAQLEWLDEAYLEKPLLPADLEQRYTARETFQRVIVNEMAKAGASALVFPTTQVPAPTRAELDGGRWTTLTFPTNTLIAAQSWLPALSVPAGFTADGRPVGMEMVALPYDEARLLAFAYAFEQQVQARRAPACAPELEP